MVLSHYVANSYSRSLRIFCCFVLIGMLALLYPSTGAAGELSPDQHGVTHSMSGTSASLLSYEVISSIFSASTSWSPASIVEYPQWFNSAIADDVTGSVNVFAEISPDGVVASGTFTIAGSSSILNIPTGEVILHGEIDHTVFTYTGFELPTGFWLTSTLPPMWPHFLADESRSWMCMPEAAAAIICLVS